MNLRIALTLLLGVAVVQSQNVPSNKPAEYPSPTIREEQQIVVDGTTETWRLQWKAAPKSYCGAKDDDALVCPCVGFAYGESGDLYLIRLRNGAEVDGLHLSPLFKEEGAAVVQRWPMDEKQDLELSESKNFSSLVRRRQTVQVMQFADYDHDGKQTEFYLQTETLPCGKSVGVVIGVSADNPRLHAFGTAASPSKPLYLQKREWQALRDAASSPVHVVDWTCGDHGAETQIEVHLQWSAKGIDGKRREYSCPTTKEHRRFIKQTPL